VIICGARATALHAVDSFRRTSELERLSWSVLDGGQTTDTVAHCRRMLEIVGDEKGAFLTPGVAIIDQVRSPQEMPGTVVGMKLGRGGR
jgi:predicted oxidoreductase